MKNPFVYGYLPLITIVLFSSTFGLYTVSQSIQWLNTLGIYNGMSEFLSDLQIRMLLLIIFGTAYFMIFSALKLIGETIHDLGMLFFAKNADSHILAATRMGNVIFFIGALLTALGINSLLVLGSIFFLTILIYFIFVTYKSSEHMSIGATIGVMLFEIICWAVLFTLIIYAAIKLYNVIVSSLPVSL